MSVYIDNTSKIVNNILSTMNPKKNPVIVTKQMGTSTSEYTIFDNSMDYQKIVVNMGVNTMVMELVIDNVSYNIFGANSNNSVKTMDLTPMMELIRAKGNGCIKVKGIVNLTLFCY